MTLSIPDLQLIAPEIAHVAAAPDIGMVNLTVEVGRLRTETRALSGTIVMDAGPMYRTIAIRDVDLALVRGQSELIDLIRAAVEACKKANRHTVFDARAVMGIGKERAKLLDQRVHRTAPDYDWVEDGPLPLETVAVIPAETATPPPPPKRFDDGDDAFADRMRAKELKRMKEDND